MWYWNVLLQLSSTEECAPQGEDEESGDNVHEQVVNTAINVTNATPVGSEKSDPTCSHAERATSLEILSDHSPNDSEEPSSERKHRRSVTDDDNSIVFAAFHDLESPLPPRKSLEISFQSDSYLSGTCHTEIEDSHATPQPTQPHTSVADQRKLASDVQFGSFEVDSSASKEEQHEEECVRQKSERGTPVEIPEDSTQQKPQNPQPPKTCSSPVSSQNEGKRSSLPLDVETLVPSDGSVNPTCTEKSKEVEYVFSAENFSLEVSRY